MQLRQPTNMVDVAEKFLLCVNSREVLLRKLVQVRFVSAIAGWS